MSSSDKLENIMKIYPRRLVFMHFTDVCMYCDNPKGEAYVSYVYLEDKIGYIACILCKEKLAESVKIWKEELAYDKANYLKNSNIKIRRSDNSIESGWRLCNPVLSIDDNKCGLLQCINEERKIYKWCKLDDILELNPNN